MPEISLPVFSGNQSEWAKFWHLFTIAVDESSLPPIEKLVQLHTVLKGDALELANGFPLKDANYRVVFEALKERFSDPSARRRELQRFLISPPVLNLLIFIVIPHYFILILMYSFAIFSGSSSLKGKGCPKDGLCLKTKITFT